MSLVRLVPVPAMSSRPLDVDVQQQSDRANLAPDLIDAGDFRRLVRLFKPAAAIGVTKCRVGNAADGGYVMLDALRGTEHAFSFGVGDNVSWDLDVANLGALVHQYDHTVQAPPAMHPNFRFHRLRIAAEPDLYSETIASIIAHLSLKSGDPAPILKIDIEHDEWSILDAAKDEDLARFSQIAAEFHWFERASDPEWLQRAERVLKKMNELFQVVHVHGNNCAPYVIVAGVPFPSVLEVTYANRSKFTFEPTNEDFPTPIDMPNNSAFNDYWLGQFRF